MLDLLKAELHTVDVVVAVEATVNAVVLAVVGNVKRGEKIHRVAKMLTGLDPGLLSHLFEKRLRRRREKGFEIFHTAGLMLQGCPYIFCSVDGVVIRLHLGDDFLPHVGLNDLHSREIFHVILSACWIGLKLMFSGKRLLREVLRIHKKLVFHN